MSKQLLSDAVDDYMALRSSQDLSRRTLANERGVLKRLLLVAGNVWTHNLEQRHVTRYFEDASKTRSPRSLQLDHTVLNQFFEWARGTRRMPLDRDPMYGRRRPKARHKERNRLDVSRFADLLEAAGVEDSRDRALVALMLYTLGRDQEIAELRVGDVDLDGGWIHLTVSKSHMEDMVPISSELDTELRDWLSDYTTALSRPLKPSDYLIPRRVSVGRERGARGRIVSHTMRYAPHQKIGRPGKVVVRYLEAVGFPVEDANGERLREGSHTIRRSGARALFDRFRDQGRDHALRIVQSLLHHASITTTETYIGVEADRLSRDELLRGKPMYPAPDRAQVVRLNA